MTTNPDTIVSHLAGRTVAEALTIVEQAQTASEFILFDGCPCLIEGIEVGNLRLRCHCWRGSIGGTMMLCQCPYGGLHADAVDKAQPLTADEKRLAMAVREKLTAMNWYGPWPVVFDDESDDPVWG